MTALDRDALASALTPAAVLAHFGVRWRRSGDELRFRACPHCGERSRVDTVALNANTGRWIDHAHQCAGDLFDLIAGYAGLARRDFPRVLEIAAEIAGVTAIAPERRHKLQIERDARVRTLHEKYERRRQFERRDAIERAAAMWNGLSTCSPAGEAYLRARGVAGVLEMGLVRFAPNAVAIALRGADGAIVNVVRRRIEDTDNGPKVRGLRSCQTAGTFVDTVAHVAHGREVVLVEGVFDALTARLAWPNAVILGAHGACNLRKIAAAVTKRVRLAGTRMLLVPHADEAGERGMIEAGRTALADGLLHRETLLVIDVGAKDLNEAWGSGWTP
jgi:hypothetical protein